MKKSYKGFYPLLYVIAGCCVLLTALAWFVHPLLCAAMGVVSAGVVAVTWWMIAGLRRRAFQVIDVVASDITFERGAAIQSFPLPTAVTAADGEILWHNGLFAAIFGKGEGDCFSDGLSRLISGFNLAKAKQPTGCPVRIGDRFFSAFAAVSLREGRETSVVYLCETTKLKRDSIEYLQSRPCIFSILVDNYDDILQSYKESEKARVTGEVERSLEEFVGRQNGILIKMNNRRFFAVVEYRYMHKIIEERFPILDDVRKITVDGKVPITVSIGVGMQPDNLTGNLETSRHALDMALGRGGDQVAVKTVNGYDFYGGVSKGVEKRTKVRARIIASALLELCKIHRQVIIMGHRFSDMDSVGSSAGLCRGLRLLGIDAFVAVDRQTTLSAPLIEQIGAAGFESLVVDAAAARDLVDDETLVVVMDTHAKPMVEVPELLERCKSVVVIDHHRKRVDYIENAVIFYHEPYSSSASEMVAELLQYLGDGEKEVEAVFAEALLAGLVLDTKNFAVKTGVKTFEAAGYLRSLGADTVEVKRLFSSTMEDFQNRTAIVTGAHVYKSCAIAKSPDDIPDIRVVSAQAADELLEISDVRASFVLFSQGSQVNISARSLGQLNVQLILESLGGGGHHTMAGAQLRETSLDTAVKMLEKSIDLYYEQNHIQ